jgi:hypothetical protein
MPIFHKVVRPERRLLRFLPPLPLWARGGRGGEGRGCSHLPKICINSSRKRGGGVSGSFPRSEKISKFQSSFGNALLLWPLLGAGAARAQHAVRIASLTGRRLPAKFPHFLASFSIPSGSEASPLPNLLRNPAIPAPNSGILEIT